MSTEYMVTVKRKADDKALGSFMANELKTIIGSEFADKIGCDENPDGRRFEFNDLETVFNAVWKNVAASYAKISEKKFMVCAAKSAQIKRELEEDIRFVEEDIEEYSYIMRSAAKIMGKVQAVAEDLEKDGEFAYRYNGEDLPKKKAAYSNGLEQEYSVCVWNADVYCEITIC